MSNGKVKAGTRGRVFKDKGRKAVAKKAETLKSLVIEYVPVGSVFPNDYNPNRQSEHDFELLQRSMEEDGFTQPIICLRASRKIVDGEHRWRAAQSLGYTEVPVVFTDMTPEQARIATLRHNRARGSEDVELTAQLLRDLRELGALDWAADSLMLDEVEMERLLEDIPAPEVLAGAEFSGAWVPSNTAEPTGDASTAAMGSAGATTAGASQALREQEERIKEAKTDEDRAAAQRDVDVYRLAMVFTSDEAEVVRAALGDRPAERLLGMCEVVREEVKRPHVANNSGNNEWFTPTEYIERARRVMGGIDLDPASCEIANRMVGATTYYSAADDGLTKQWAGRVWMNPPYSQPLIEQFVGKLVASVRDGSVEQAIVLVNNATETVWGQALLGSASAVCFPCGRVRFLDSESHPVGAPLQGQVIVYIGARVAEFMAEFDSVGVCLRSVASKPSPAS